MSKEAAIRALIAAVSLATLAMELFLTKVLSFVLWNHLVYLVISIALLGYGISSTFVLLAQRRIERWGGAVFLAANVLLFALCAIGALLFIAHTTYEFSTTHPLDSAASLLATYVALTLPFFFAGNVIVYLFVSNRQSVNALYGWDLAGAAAGCLLFPVLMPWFGAPGSIAFVLAIACLAGLGVLLVSSAGARSRMFAAATAVIALLLAAGVPRMDGWLDFMPDRTKSTGRAFDARVNRGVVREYHKWDVITRLDILSGSEPFDIGWMKIEPGTKLVDFDGDAGSEMAKLAPGFPTSDDTRRFFDTDYRAPFFREAAHGNHLVIGLGGGPDVAQSLAMGASRITVVEINSAILQAMGRDYAGYSGNLLNRPNVRVIHSEGRNFMRSTREKFDLIRMTGVDTFAAHTTGAYVLAENYLYTVEAFREYFRRLGDDGVLSVQRWFEPGTPRESLRLFAVILQALRAEGVEHPEDHVIVLWRRTEQMQPPGVTLVRKKPFSEAEVRSLDQQLGRVARLENVFPIYYPRTAPGPLVESRIFHGYADAFSNGAEKAVQELYPFDIAPVTDDKPFFFNYYKAANMFRDWNKTGPIHGYWAYFVFGLIIACASAAVAVFVWLPLWVFRREGLSARGSGALALYFSCLGLGFIMIEITAMQKFALVLGHPMYSIATVMGGMLVFAGLGSALSGRLLRTMRPAQLLTACAIVVAAFCVLLSSGASAGLIDKLLALTFGERIAATLAIVAVAAIPLGFFFPLGLSIASRESERFIPWAWGINAGFTVIGSVLSIAAAMKFGFSTVLLLSAALYLCALLLIRRYEETASLSIPAP